MPVDLQVGSPAEQARRAFNLRGGFSMQLDETVSPTCAVRDLTGGPFRTEGVRVIAGNNAPAVAAQFSNVQFRNDAAFGSSVMVVLDGVLVSNPSAAVMAFQMGFTLGLLATSRTGDVSEYAPTGSSIGDILSQTQFISSFGSGAGTAITRVKADFVLNPGVSIYIPLDVVLPPTLSWVIEGGTLNAAVSATAFARYFRGT